MLYAYCNCNDIFGGEYFIMNSLVRLFFEACTYITKREKGDMMRTVTSLPYAYCTFHNNCIAFFDVSVMISLII